MKKICLVALFFFFIKSSFAQTDSLTLRDDIRLKYLIKKNLIPGYEKLLNFIADPGNFENEINDAINFQVKGSKEVRIFTDEKVIIENDLKPKAEGDKSARLDLDVISYLKKFNTGYKKTEDKTILLAVTKISNLKFTSYFYYNVEFETTYNGESSTGDHFDPFTRIAEVKLLNDSGWHVYINSIRFANLDENDSNNDFKYLIKSDTNVVNILKAYDDEEQQRLRDQKARMQLLLEDGEDKFANGEFEAALRKFKEARLINTDFKEAKAAVIKARNAITKKKELAQQKEERDAHIKILIADAHKQQENYNFNLARIICDSLLIDYGVKDADIIQMKDELSVLNATMEGVNTAIEKGNLTKAEKICKENSGESVTNAYYRSEFYYQLAVVYAKDDKPSAKKIFECLDNAIVISKKHHQLALKMRAKMFMDDKQVENALQDASLIVNNDSRNPEVYCYRAQLLEADLNYPKAIDDYNSALINKSIDPEVYYNKARLEYKVAKYKDAIKTSTDGLKLKPCHSLLLFYRGASEEKSGDFVNAGNDFWKATKICGLADSAKSAIKEYSNIYFLKGDSYFNEKKIPEAIAELSKSILIDSSDNSLFKRAQAFLFNGKNDSAIVDLNALIKKNTNYTSAYALRGKAYSSLMQFEAANNDFNTESNKFPKNTIGLFYKGESEIKQKKYKEAITSLERAVDISENDSLFYLLSLANYLFFDYNKAISNSKKAQNKKTTNYEIYNVCGKAYYELGKYNDAIDSFEKAKKLALNSDEVIYNKALALEKNKEFVKASEEFDNLQKSTVYKDTAMFRSALNLVKANDEKYASKAIRQFEQYIRLADTSKERVTTMAWMAYQYIKKDMISSADKVIEDAIKLNDKNPTLKFVQACMKVKVKNNENAYDYLESAIASKLFSLEEIKDEELLKPLFKSDRFKQLINKYYK